MSLVFFLIQLTFVYSADITGRIITTPVVMSIIVETDLASIFITTPENKTYITNKFINLTYIAANEDTVWYNLDNSANITISGSTLFNTTKGQHTLYLYANSSLGNLTAKNVTFFTNSSIFTIIYNNYSGSNRGDSTNFNKTSYEDLQNITGIILEDSSLGKIVFNEAINTTEDADYSDNILNLDINTKISNNLITLNSSALPNFNVSATLSLYGLNFSNPRILMDNSICPEDICTKINYSGGILEFNVTHFTDFSSEETPIVNIPTSTGGGGGSSEDPDYSFNISTSTIGVSIKTGTIITKEIIITNPSNNNQNFNIEIQGLENLVFVRPSEFSLGPKESRIIFLDFIAREDQPTELYLGKLIFKSESKTKEVLIAVDVESQQELFDVDIHIPKDYLEIFPGKDLVAEIELLSMGDSDKIDVEIEYFIKDLSGNIINYHKDTRAVVTKLNFIETFHLLENIKPGRYILYVKVNYSGNVASASQWFSIIEESYPMKQKINQELLLLILGLAIIIISIIFVIINHKKKPVKKKT